MACGRCYRVVAEGTALGYPLLVECSYSWLAAGRLPVPAVSRLPVQQAGRLLVPAAGGPLGREGMVQPLNERKQLDGPISKGRTEIYTVGYKRRVTSHLYRIALQWQMCNV